MNGPLTALYEATGDRDDFVLISIGVWDDGDAMATAIEERGYDWTFVYDPTDRVTQRTEGVALDYGVSGIPTLVRVDPEGIVEAIAHFGLARELYDEYVEPTPRAKTERVLEMDVIEDGVIAFAEPAYRFTAPESATYTFRTAGAVATTLAAYGSDAETPIATGSEPARLNLEIERGSVVFIAVNADPESTGRFGIRATIGDGPSLAEFASPITAGEIVDGAITGWGDSVYRFVAPEAGEYTFRTVTRAPHTLAAVAQDAETTLAESSGAPVVSLALAEGDAIFVTVNAPIGVVGPFRLRATGEGSPDFGEIASPIVVDTILDGELEGWGDPVVYRFVAPEAGPYRFRALGRARITLGAVAQDAETPLAESSGEPTLSLDLAEGDVIFVTVNAPAGVVAPFRLRSDGEGGPDFGEIASPIEVDATLVGALEGWGDPVVYRFVAPEAGPYSFRALSRASLTLGAVAQDAETALAESSGEPVVAVELAGGDIIFVTVNAPIGVVGPFRLRASGEGGLDLGALALPIEAGATVDGEFDGWGDPFVFRFVSPEAGPYSFRTLSRAPITLAAVAEDTETVLAASSGAAVLSLELDEGDVIFVTVNAPVGFVGPFSLRSRAGAAALRTDTELVLTVGESVSGTESGWGESVYLFVADEAGEYAFTTVGPLDTVLTIFDEDGVSQLAENDDNPEGERTTTSLIRLHLDAGAIVYVEVTGWNANVGDYGLAVEMNESGSR